MTYEYIRAEDYCDSVRDGTHDTPKPAENGYKLVTGKHIRDGRIDSTEAYYISEKDYIKINERSKVDQWDVLMSMIGNGLGRSAVVDDLPNYAIKNIALFKVGDEIKAKWLHYYLSGKEGQGRIYNSLQGSGQPFISLSYIRDFPVPNPPQDTMKRVVGVLEQYDYLIDNNQKQIKLLEEAAQRLYKEWFVDLRFPGYEDTPIVDGVPEGWKKIGLASIAPIVTGKKDANFGTPDGKYLFFTCAQEPIKAPSYSFDCDAVILAGNGDFNVKLYRGQFEAYQRTYVFSPYDSYHLYLLYYAVRESMRKLFQGASGSTIKFLTKHMLEDIDVFIPDTDTLKAFNSTCDVIQTKIECLKAQIMCSKESRDRLLPKLMSGEIKV